MPRTDVVVLSNHTLYGEGVISRLEQHQEELNLSIVEADTSDVIDQIISLTPAVLIIDGSEPATKRICPLEKLLEKLPALKVIRLDPLRSGVQLITSSQHRANVVGDLIEIISAEA